MVLDPQGEPVTVSASGDEQRNVIVWMDHRATAEARLINETEDAVLRYVGGARLREARRLARGDGPRSAGQLDERPGDLS